MRYLIALLILILIQPIYSQNTDKNKVFMDSCRQCPFPTYLKSNSDRNSNFLFDVKFKGGESIKNCLSISRLMFQNLGREEQGAKITYLFNGSCKDTIVIAAKIKELKYGDIGSAGQPMVLPFLPARMFFREQGSVFVPSSFLELSGFLGFGGSYNNPNNRDVGFSSIYYGLDALVNPFGSILGENLALAIGGELLIEAGRIRIPVFGHLRWKFWGKQTLGEKTDNFVPGVCKIRNPNDEIIDPNDKLKNKEQRYQEIPQSSDALDSSVYFVREKVVFTPFLRPYLFVEAGPIFNSTFKGAGNSDVVNPDLYGQYFIGGGLGANIGSFLQLSLAYRYMRLNLKTECIPCNNLWVQNVNESHSVVLKAGFYFNW